MCVWLCRGVVCVGGGVLVCAGRLLWAPMLVFAAGVSQSVVVCAGIFVRPSDILVIECLLSEGVVGRVGPIKHNNNQS